MSDTAANVQPSLEASTWRQGHEALVASRIDAIRAAIAADAELTESKLATNATLSQSRLDGISAGMLALEARLIAMIAALNDVINLRSEMSGAAIIKAEQATEHRFAGVNEFRQTLTDQAGLFATRIALDGKFDQCMNAVLSLERSLAAATLYSQTERTSISNRLTALETKLYLGGAALVIIISIVQVAVDFLHH